MIFWTLSREEKNTKLLDLHSKPSPKSITYKYLIGQSARRPKFNLSNEFFSQIVPSYNHMIFQKSKLIFIIVFVFLKIYVI